MKQIRYTMFCIIDIAGYRYVKCFAFSIGCNGTQNKQI